MQKIITYLLLLLVALPAIAQNEINREPEFIGGQSKMVEYISQNAVYPDELKKEGVSGIVLVSVVIKKDGTVSKPKVTQKIHPQLDKEAIRVVKSMPKWNPGAKNGKKANMPYTIPVSFNPTSGLAGLWQMRVPVDMGDGKTELRSIPYFKIINEDGTFEMLASDKGGMMFFVSCGTYKINSDNSYTEYVEKSIPNPTSSGKSFEIGYQFASPNELIISYTLLDSGKTAHEYWVRVTQPNL